MGLIVLISKKYVLKNACIIKRFRPIGFGKNITERTYINTYEIVIGIKNLKYLFNAEFVIIFLSLVLLYLYEITKPLIIKNNVTGGRPL